MGCSCLIPQGERVRRKSSARASDARCHELWAGLPQDEGICLPADLCSCLPSGPPPCVSADLAACLPAAITSQHDHGKDAVGKAHEQAGCLVLPQNTAPAQTPFFQRTRKARGPAASLVLHGLFLAALLGFSFQTVHEVPGNAMIVSLASLAPAPAASSAFLPAGAPPPPAAPAQPEPAPTSAPQKPAHEPLAEARPKPVAAKKAAAVPAEKKERAIPAPERPKPAAPPASTPAQASLGGSTAVASGPPADADAASGADKVYSPRQLDQSPAVTRGVQPDYPSSARSRRVEGRVIVRMVVETSGQPGQCSIHSANPQGYFEEAALDAARRMRFRPGTKAGKAVRTLVLLPFDFNLR